MRDGVNKRATLGIKWLRARETKRETRPTERQAEGLPLLPAFPHGGKRKAKGSREMRGCEKRVVVLRHADSSLFEEAYFVMRRASGRASHTDMVTEAERLLTGGEASPFPEEKKEKEPKRKKDGRARRAFLSLFWFCLGGLCAVAVVFVL